jgi:putative salt-induced outer membrane protein
MRAHHPVILVTALLLAAATAIADEPEQPPTAPWTGSLGLSFVATSGNTDTRTLGFDFQVKRKPTPWGMEAGASYTRADENNLTTAERYAARARAERSFSARWSAFGGLTAERDRFAGYDLRTVVNAGATYTALAGPRHELAFDGGLTWTREELVDNPTDDYAGGLLGATYLWHLAETSAFGEHVVWYPNFQESSDWRLMSETSLTAAVNTKLALKLSYELRYDHQPVPGFKGTDTTTKASLLWSF